MNNDTIYRRAAIDAFGLSEKTRKFGGDHSGYETMMLYEIQDIIENIPAAEPSTAILKVEVSAEEAMETVKNKLSDYFDTLWKTAYERGKAEAHPRKGKWIPVTNGRGGHECDQCHEYAPSWQTGEEHLTNYCPNCGARMTEENGDREN